MKSQILGAPFRDDVEIGSDKAVLVEPEVLADEPLDPVPRHCVSNPAAHGYPDPGAAYAVLGPDHDEMGRVKLLSRSGKMLIIPPLKELVFPAKGIIHNTLLARDGDRQSLPPLGASPLDYQPAVLGGHADKKAVGSFSRNIAWLKGSFHIRRLPWYGLIFV